MAHRDVVLADVDVRVGVAAADRIDQQRIALHAGTRAVRALVDLDQAAVGSPPAAAGHGLGHDVARRVGRQVQHLGAGVLMLALAGERHREHLTLGVLAGHPHRRVFHCDLGADVAVDPLHGRARLGAGPLGHQVVDVVRPVLDGRVADPCTGFHDDLDHCRVQGVALVDRRSAIVHGESVSEIAIRILDIKVEHLFVRLADGPLLDRYGEVVATVPSLLGAATTLGPLHLVDVLTENVATHDHTRSGGAPQFDRGVVTQARQDGLQLECPHPRGGVDPLPFRPAAPDDVAVAIHVGVYEFAQEHLVLAHHRLGELLGRRAEADMSTHRRVAGFGVDQNPRRVLVLLD